MSDKQSKFRLVKSGYDRFAVDNAVEDYQRTIEDLKKQIEVYNLQIKHSNEQLELIKSRYSEVFEGLQGKEKAADEIARLSLREANRIIETAQNNADLIIQEALTTAKLILVEITNLSNQVVDRKEDMMKQAEELKNIVEQFDVPKVQAMRHIKK